MPTVTTKDGVEIFCRAHGIRLDPDTLARLRGAARSVGFALP